jgi:ribonuclease HI
MLDFSWNLGINTNNMEEAYAMYQGVLLVQEQKLNSITIVGDSKNIIRHFATGTTPKNTKLQRIIERIKSLMSPIQANFIHVPPHK